MTDGPSPQTTTLSLPRRAQVVVVGGGVVGCSVAYHLTRRGWRDVVLLERKRLTSGTTWHAAGLVTTGRPTHGMRAVVERSIKIFEGLEAETGLSTGYRRTGTVQLATGPDRWEELKRQASSCRGSGIEVELVSPARAKELFPLLDTGEVTGALHFPMDGRGNATDTTMSLARGARLGGARIYENVLVDEVTVERGRAVGVRVGDDRIEAEFVVNCTGMWGRAFAGGHGVPLPLQALHHYYVITEELPGLPADMPTLKSPDDYSYVKDEAGKLMVGFFEPGSKPYGSKGIPKEAEFTTLPEDWDHLGPFYEKMTRRIPVLGEVGIRLFFCGPESFTPDGVYHLGEAPGLANYFVAAGFNSIGFLSGPGAGQVLADWIVDGHRPLDLIEADPKRSVAFQANRRYLEERVTETLDLSYEIHWPYQQRRSARGLRRSPLHHLVAQEKAVFGEVAGWERANWYADDTAGDSEETFGRQPFFEAVGREHLGVRSKVGIFDLSSFGKLLVAGRDALSLLQRVSANDVDVEPGRAVYTQWLNESGGIEADLTVTRTGEEEFLVLTAASCLVRDRDWLERHKPVDGHVFVTDLSAAMAMISVMGPRSRELLQGLSDTDLSNEAFPFAASREIDLGYLTARATRISYVGELGFELLVSSEMACHLYEVLLEAGRAHELGPAGYYALDSLRLEKGYRSFGHDIGPLDTPLEAGLGFAVSWKKAAGFLGQDALAAKREEGLSRRIVQLSFEDEQATPYHDEPVYKDGELVGRLTSSAFGYSLGRPVALGWVAAPGPVEPSWFEAPYEVEIAAERFGAEGSLRPLYDPSSARVRS